MYNLTRTSIYYGIFGVFLFSSMGSTLTALLGFHFSVPEMFLVMFLFFNRRDNGFFPINRKRTINLIFIWLLLLLIALFIHNYPVYGILSTARGWFLIFCMLAYSPDREPFSWDHWMALSIGSLVGWAICSVLSYFSVSGSEIGIVYGTSLAIPVVLLGSLLDKKKYTFLFALILIFAICFFAGIRRPMVFVAFTIIVCLYYGIKHFGVLKSMLAGAVIFGVVWILAPPLLSKMEESHSATYYRIVVRTQKAFTKSEGLTPGDTLRSSMIQQALRGENATCFPQGFVSKQTLVDNGTGRFWDVPLFEVTETFGLILGWGIIAYFLYLSLCLISRHRKNSKLYGYVGIAMLIALFLDGYFITAPFACIYSGLCIGAMFREAHLQSQSIC